MPDIHQPSGAADERGPDPLLGPGEGGEQPEPSAFAKPNRRTGEAPDDEDDLN